jgi:hypothetical protein
MTRAALFAAAFLLGIGVALPAWAQPAGQPMPVINQGQKLVTVTPSDTVPIGPNPAIALYNGNASACNISIRAVYDCPTLTSAASACSAATILQNVPSGAFIPIRTLWVTSTGTTCSNIVALY